MNLVEMNLSERIVAWLDSPAANRASLWVFLGAGVLVLVMIGAQLALRGW